MCVCVCVYIYIYYFWYLLFNNVFIFNCIICCYSIFKCKIGLHILCLKCNGFGRWMLLQWQGNVSKVEAEYVLNKWGKTKKSFSFYSPISSELYRFIHAWCSQVTDSSKPITLWDDRFQVLTRLRLQFIFFVAPNEFSRADCLCGASCQAQSSLPMLSSQPFTQIKDLLLWLSFPSLITV